MPNIQIIGFRRTEAEVIRSKLDEMLRDIGLGEEAITDIVEGHDPKSCDGEHRPMPYLRIYGTDVAEIGDIIIGLKRFMIHVDCEWLLLGGFISAEEMAQA